MKSLFKKILAIGLAATMTLGMAVTSFATGEEPGGVDLDDGQSGSGNVDLEGDEDEDTPTAAEYDATVWVNGKDVKAKGDVKAAFYKTASVKLADLKTEWTAAKYEVAEENDKLTVDTSKTTAAGTAVYEYKATYTNGTNAAVQVPVDGKPKVGTYTYTAAVVDNAETDEDETAAAYWTLDEEKLETITGVKIEGTPADGSTVKVDLVWTITATGTTVEIKDDATVEAGTTVEIVKSVQEGLSASLPAKHKYLISVMAPAAEDAAANTYEAAFPGNKAKKSNVVKVKFNKKTNDFTVTAGKEAGVVEVWIAELDSKAKKITAYEMFTVEAKMAPVKFDILVPAVMEGEGESAVEKTPAITKKTTLSVKDDITLSAIASKPTTVDEDTTYTWSVKLPKGFTEKDVTVEPATDTKSATFTFTKLADESKAANFTITCVNDQSQKKASFKVTVVNNIKTVTLGDVAMDCAYTDKVVKEFKLGSDAFTLGTDANDALKELKSTDKVKAYITSNAKNSQEATDSTEAVYEGYIYTKGEKKDTFKLTEKSKAVSAKIAKDGTLTITAKKGTEPGTQVKLLLVITHKDKTIEVKESVVTVGKAATSIVKGTVDTTLTLKVGKTQALDPTITASDADVVWTTDNKKVATVDEKGVVTAKKAGSANITVKSGEKELVYAITVEEEAAATTQS